MGEKHIDDFMLSSNGFGDIGNKTEIPIPLDDRYMMTLNDASGYFGLSTDTIYDMSENIDARFALLIDEEIYIKTDAFAEYLDDHFLI